MAKPKSILFVCLGNIVRSPLAEHIFRSRTKESPDLNEIEVSSAGTSSYHIGEPPDPRMRETAAKHGVHYDGRARKVTSQDLRSYDLIIAMDQENYADLNSMMLSLMESKKIRLLREFDPERGHDLAIPDPYYGGQDGFEKTFRIVNRSINGLINSIKDNEI